MPRDVLQSKRPFLFYPPGHPWNFDLLAERGQRSLPVKEGKDCLSLFWEEEFVNGKCKTKVEMLRGDVRDEKSRCLSPQFHQPWRSLYWLASKEKRIAHPSCFFNTCQNRALALQRRYRRLLARFVLMTSTSISLRSRFCIRSKAPLTRHSSSTFTWTTSSPQCPYLKTCDFAALVPVGLAGLIPFCPLLF